MHRLLNNVLPWTIILLPFVILAAVYGSLPGEILVARNLDGSGAVVAPKSLFYVFRVPLIEVVCALAIELMRRRAGAAASESQKAYYSMWTILLYTVAFKSLLQALETIASNGRDRLFLYLTLGVVVAGIVLAAFPALKAFRGPNREKLRIGGWELLVLVALLAAYLGLALGPIYL